MQPFPVSRMLGSAVALWVAGVCWLVCVCILVGSLAVSGRVGTHVSPSMPWKTRREGLFGLVWYGKL